MSAALAGHPPRTLRTLLPMKFLAGGAVIALAMAYLAYVSLSSATAYYLTVGELQAKGTGPALVRVSGRVATQSIGRDASALHFALSDSSGQLPVVYRGVVPDIFAEGIEVVVEGRYAPDATFHATHLLTKCPSRFESAGQPGAP